MYLGAAALKRFHDDGQPRRDEMFLRWAGDQALHTVQEALRGVLDNLPNRPAAWAVKALIFPLGAWYRPPSDRVTLAAARMLLENDEARDALTKGIYIPPADEPGLGMLEATRARLLAIGDLETKWIAALTDPFGLGSISLATEYWTTVEKNTQLLGMSGWVLMNRLLWMGVAVAIVAFAAARFRFSQSASEGRKKRKRGKSAVDVEVSVRPADIEVPTADRTFGGGAVWAQFRALAGRSFREVIASPFFFAILLAGVLFLILNATQLESIFGTRTWPMAWKVIEILGGSFSLFVMM